jgi:hypothetical protein
LHQDGKGNGQTLAVVDNETAKRVKGVLYAVRALVEQNAPSGSMSKMAYIILPALADEMCDEMAELDEMTIRIIMSQIGEIIAWIGHGDNERLPDSLREFAEGIQPTPIEAESPETDQLEEIVEAEIVE